VADPAIEGLLRRLAPQVLGAVVRRYGNFDTAEDAVQEALLAAALQWPADGVGVALITGALPRGEPGQYQLQAAIAAVHDESPSADATDWPQIVALYELLMRRSANPIVALNHAVAVTMASGPAAGLALLEGLSALASDHRLHAVRAHLLHMSGDTEGARTSYLTAARLTSSLPQQRYLNARAASIEEDPRPVP